MSADDGRTPPGAPLAEDDAVPELPAFRQLVKQLVLVRKLSQSDLFDHIRKVLVEEAKALPKVQVAYCSSYGGWDVSEQFEKYLEASGADMNINSNEGRTLVVPHIAPFGRQCAAAHPDIAAAIRTYNHYELGDVFRDVNRLDMAVKDGSKAAANLVRVCNLEDTPDNFGIDETRSVYLADREQLNANDIKDCTKVSLIVACVRKMRETSQVAKEFRKKLLGRRGIDPAMLHLIIESISFKFPDEIENERRPYYRRENLSEVDGRYISFTEAIELYKGSPKQRAIWKCQDYFEEKPMRFLIRHPGVLPPPPSAPPAPTSKGDGEDDTDMQMGLLFASSPYCRIKIAKVPQIVDWEIGEYDGLEKVVIV